ncbi:MAG: rhodanese-like domain-containing protein [Nitrosomonadales bacterium]|nr:rhodanese-like domain-containing protein [Nitrosomonadales bacterium]
MNKRHAITGWLSSLSAALFLLVLSNSCAAQVADISQTELLRRINTHYTHIILDVRSPEEYKEGHLPGAVNIPFDRLDSRLAEIDPYKNKEVVLYCGSGGRVIIAALILRSAGFKNLLHLDGDMDGWISNGKLPVAR